MSTPDADPRISSSEDFRDGARYEGQVRDAARANTGHKELIDFIEKLAAAEPWASDHDLCLKAAYVYAPGIEKGERVRRAARISLGKSVHAEQRK